MPTWVSNAPSTSTNAFRLRATTTQSPSSVGSGTTSVTVRLRIWLETRRAMYSSSGVPFSVSGSWPSRSTSVSFNHPNNSSDWPSENVTLIYDETITVSTSTAGSVSRSFSTSISGMPAVSGTASMSETHTVPQRPVTVVPPSAPGRPSITSVTASTAGLAWAHPADSGGSAITAYQSQRATNSGFTAGVISTGPFTGRSYVWEGLSADTDYWVRVRAQNSAGWGPWSSGRGLRTRPLGPLAPTNLSASRSADRDDRTLVAWTRNVAAGRPVNEYELRLRHMRADGSWSAFTTRAVLPGTRDSVVVVTEANRRYEFALRAINSAGRSGWAFSNEIDTTPAAPANVQATPSSSGISLTWTNRVWFPAGVEVERQEGTGPWLAFRLHAPGTTSSTLIDPDMEVTHRFRLRAYGIGTPALNSPWVYSNRVQLAAPPAAPTNLGPGTPWDAAEDREWTWRHVPTDGSGQERFQVRHRSQGGAWTTETEVASEVSSWTLPADTYSNGDVVEWQVRTWGVHATSSPWSATQVTSPVARPTVAIAAPVDGGLVEVSSALLEWAYAQGDDPGDEAPQAAWRWTLERDGQLVQERAGSTGQSSVTVAGLVDGADYVLRVQVRSADGLWSLPDEVAFQVAYMSPDAPEVDVSWHVDGGAAVVALTQPDWQEGSGVAEPSFHQVWRAIDDGPWLLIADEVPLGSAVVDPIAKIGDGHVNHYRATTVSVLPSTADSFVFPLAVTAKMTQGWVYLNSGPGMSRVCRVRANASRSDEEGTPAVVEYDSGRSAPTIQGGTAHSLTWDVSARIAPDYDGASTRGELVEMQQANEPVMYRDPTGARWVGYMGPISSSWRSILGEVSWSMQQVEFSEGLDRQERVEEPEVPVP